MTHLPAKPPAPRDAPLLEVEATPASAAALPTLLFVVFMNLLGFGMVIPLLPFYARSFHAEIRLGSRASSHMTAH